MHWLIFMDLTMLQGIHMHQAAVAAPVSDVPMPAFCWRLLFFIQAAWVWYKPHQHGMHIPLFLLNFLQLVLHPVRQPCYHQVHISMNLIITSLGLPVDCGLCKCHILLGLCNQCHHVIIEFVLHVNAGVQ